MVHALRGSTDDPTQVDRVHSTDRTPGASLLPGALSADEPKTAEESADIELDPVAQENERVERIVHQIDEEIRMSALELTRQEEERKRDFLLRSKGPFDTNPVRVAHLRDGGTGDTVELRETLDINGSRVLQGTMSVLRKSHDVEKRKSPTASPHTEEV